MCKELFISDVKLRMEMAPKSSNFLLKCDTAIEPLRFRVKYWTILKAVM